MLWCDHPSSVRWFRYSNNIYKKWFVFQTRRLHNFICIGILFHPPSSFCHLAWTEHKCSTTSDICHNLADFWAVNLFCYCRNILLHKYKVQHYHQNFTNFQFTSPSGNHFSVDVTTTYFFQVYFNISLPSLPLVSQPACFIHYYLTVNEMRR